MIALIFFAAAAIVIFALMGSVMPMFHRFNGWATAYDRVAKRYNGRVNRGFLLMRPSLNFLYGRAPVHLKNQKNRPHHGGDQTQVAIQWPKRNLRLYVSTFSPPFGYWGNRKMKPITIGNWESSQEIFVYTNRPEEAKRLLTNAVLWQIKQLQDHLSSGVIVSIDNGQLLVSKPRFIKQFQPLDDFLRFSLELFDQLQLTYTQGIEFVADDTATIVEDVKCPICSDGIMYNMVVCVRCKTPHCSDCWEYNGQCATFACNETRFVRSGESQHHV